MSEMLRHATVEELNRMLGLVFMSEDDSDEKTSLLYEIVDELERRGDAVELPDKSAKDIAQAAVAATANPSQASIRDAIVRDVRADDARRRKMHRRIRRFSVAAASVVLTMSLVVGSAAAGFDLFGTLSRWTRDAVYLLTGHEFAEEPKEVDIYLQHLHDTVVDWDNPPKLPRQLPDGFIFDNIEWTLQEYPQDFTAWFTNGETYFSITVCESSEGNNGILGEINTDEVTEIIKHDGTDFLLFINNKRISVVWTDGNCEVLLQGQLSRDQVMQMIQTI